jgi:hypothetical protein
MNNGIAGYLSNPRPLIRLAAILVPLRRGQNVRLYDVPTRVPAVELVDNKL